MKSASPSPLSKRLVLPLILCLFLGSLTTILNAWALTFDFFRVTTPLQFAWFTTQNNRPVLVSRSETFGITALRAVIPSGDVGYPDNQWLTVEALAPAWSRSELLDWAGTEPQPFLSLGEARAIFITGWPVPCLWASYDQQPSPNFWWFKARNGIRISDSPTFPDYFTPLSPRERVLPTHIVWHAFLINTLLYALIWAALLLTPRALRRTIRKRRGRCLACGYDRRGLDDEKPCPECGFDTHQALGIRH